MGTKYNHIYLKKSFNVLEPDFFERVVTGGDIRLDSKNYIVFILSNGNVWGIPISLGGDIKFHKLFSLKSIVVNDGAKLMSEQEKITSCKYLNGTIVATTTKKGKPSFPIVIDGAPEKTKFSDIDAHGVLEKNIQFSRLTTKAVFFGIYNITNEKTYLIKTDIGMWMAFGLNIKGYGDAVFPGPDKFDKFTSVGIPKSTIDFALARYTNFFTDGTSLFNIDHHGTTTKKFPGKTIAVCDQLIGTISDGNVYVYGSSNLQLSQHNKINNYYAKIESIINPKNYNKVHGNNSSIETLQKKIEFEEEDTSDFEFDLIALLDIFRSQTYVESITDDNNKKGFSYIAGDRAAVELFNPNDLRALNQLHLDTHIIPQSATMKAFKKSGLANYFDGMTENIRIKFSDPVDKVLKNKQKVLALLSSSYKNNINRFHGYMKIYLTPFLTQYGYELSGSLADTIFNPTDCVSYVYLKLKKIGEDKLVRVNIAKFEYHDENKGHIATFANLNYRFRTQNTTTFFDWYAETFNRLTKNYSDADCVKFSIATQMFLSDSLNSKYYIKLFNYSRVAEYEKSFKEFVQTNFKNIRKFADKFPFKINYKKKGNYEYPIDKTGYKIVLTYHTKDGAKITSDNFERRIDKNVYKDIVGPKVSRDFENINNLPTLNVPYDAKDEYSSLLYKHDDLRAIKEYTADDYLSGPTYEELFLGNKKLTGNCSSIHGRYNATYSSFANSILKTFRTLKEIRKANTKLRMPETFQVYNGRRYFNLGNVRSFDYKTIMNGTSILLREITSTSGIASKARGFLKGPCCYNIIQIPNESDYAILDHYSHYGHEAEILIPFGSILHVTDVRLVFSVGNNPTVDNVFTMFNYEDYQFISDISQVNYTVIIHSDYKGIHPGVEDSEDFVSIYKSFYKLDDSRKLTEELLLRHMGNM